MSSVTSDDELAHLILTQTERIQSIIVQRLMHDKPFWCAIWFKIGKWRVASGEGTAWTDGNQIVFDAHFVSKLNVNELVGLILHELAHVILCHHLRRNNRDGHLWNMAADYVINWMLKEEDTKLPAGALLDSDYSEDHAESAYEKLFKKFPPPPGGGCGNPPGPCNGGEGGDSQGQGQGQGQGKGQGSGSGNGRPGGQGWGHVKDLVNEDGSKPTAEELQEAENAILSTVRGCIEDERMCGSLPGSLRDKFTSLVDPKLNWRVIIQDLLAEKFPQDYSWAKPNRRRGGEDFVLPGLDGQLYGMVALAVDSSGSVSEEEIRQMVSEVQGAQSVYENNGQDAEITVMYCDTRVHDVEVLGIDDIPYQNPKGGGGGTDFAPVMEHLATTDWEDEEPRLLIYLTDGHCASFGEAPDMDVLWVLVGPHAATDFKPPFGKVTNMEI